MERVDYQSMIVQDLVNDHRDDKIDLNPWYQRRSVWTRAQKSYLVNTLFERKPIPALYVRHSIDVEKGRSIKEIVDGQQRARTIIEYCSNKFSAKIDIKATPKLFNQLAPPDKDKLLLTPIPIGFLIGATDSDVIDIFARINSVSKSLNSQEKRNAKFSGEFKQFCLHEANIRLDFWRNMGIFSANDIARMNEVLFISDLVLNLLEGVSDFRPTALDKMYKENEDNFPKADEISDRLNAAFEKLYSIDKSAIIDTIFQRPPLMFSLILALDSLGNVASDRVEEAMFEIDSLFKDEDLDEAAVNAFRIATSASTQRINSRAIRDEFIKSRF